MKKIVMFLIPVLMLLMVAAGNSVEIDPEFLWKDYAVADLNEPDINTVQFSRAKPGVLDDTGTGQDPVEPEFTETSIAEFYPSGTVFFSIHL